MLKFICRNIEIMKSDITKIATLEKWIASPNSWLVILFSILWLFDCFLTVWAVSNGYTEAWNSWTKLITSSAVLFIFIKLLTLGMILGIVKWANAAFPYVIFVAMVAFNILIGTVSVANIITIITT